MNRKKRLVWTIQIPRMTLQEIFFFCSYSIFLLSGILSMSFYYRYFSGTIHHLIIACCMLFLIAKEVVSWQQRRKYTVRNLCVGIVCIILALLAYHVADGVLQQSVAYLFVFVFGARDISFRKIAQLSVGICVISLLLVIFSAYSGIILNYVMVTNNRVRTFMGFRYALYGPAIFFNIMALEVYLKQERIKITELLLLALLNGLLYEITDGRLSAYLGFLFIVVAFIMKFCPKILEKRKIFWCCGVFLFIICLCVSLYLTIHYNSSVEWQSSLNKLLGKRLYYGQKSLERYGISLFGKRITWIGNGLDQYGRSAVGTFINTYFYVDCMYIILLQRYGLVFTIMLMFLFTYTMFVCFRQKNYYLFIVLVFMAIHCMIDDLLLYLYFNTFWFSIAHVITKKGGALQSVGQY